jgi:hypothetical protein
MPAMMPTTSAMLKNKLLDVRGVGVRAVRLRQYCVPHHLAIWWRTLSLSLVSRERAAKTVSFCMQSISTETEIIDGINLDAICL